MDPDLDLDLDLDEDDDENDDERREGVALCRYMCKEKPSFAASLSLSILTTATVLNPKTTIQLHFRFHLQ